MENAHLPIQQGRIKNAQLIKKLVGTQKKLCHNVDISLIMQEQAQGICSTYTSAMLGSPKLLTCITLIKM